MSNASPIYPYTYWFRRFSTKENLIIDMTQFGIDTSQHFVGYMWIYTPHYSNSLKLHLYGSPVAVTIWIFGLLPRVFPICKVGIHYTYQFHHLVAYIMSFGIRRGISVYLGPLGGLIARMPIHSENYSRHWGEIYTTLNARNHSKVLISTFICTTLQIF